MIKNLISQLKRFRAQSGQPEDSLQDEQLLLGGLRSGPPKLDSGLEVISA